MPHFLKSAHRSGDSVRLRAERANEARALRIRCALHDDRPAGFAKLVEHRLERNNRRLAQRKNGLYDRLCRNPLDRALHGTCAALCRSACCRPICPNRSHFLLAPATFTSSQEFSPQCTATFSPIKSKTLDRKNPTTCDAPQCACPYACCGASSCPASGKPRASADDCP